MFTKIVCAVGLMTVLLSIGNAQADQSEDQMSIGQRFHHETSFGDRGFKGDGSYRGRNLPLYKVYDGAVTVSLPPPKPGSGSVEEAITQRRSTRRFADTPVSLEELSGLLLAAAGITYHGKGLSLRAAPSGGALYPCEIYVVAQNVDSLKAGLYHYQVSDSTLELVEEEDHGRQLHQASHNQNAVGSSPVTVVLTARFDRSTRKYGDRGFRYAYIEVGAIAENICLQAASLSLGTVCIGAFNDDALNQLLGIDGKEEAALLIMPVGIPR
ncbi:MAG: SagB/ThcOx family dehydrogenase [candidate division Zixibacteria bacterium]|nr:SagB/ThcOx family dehydrogenase [candidate division Zixibacteria bacterium]